MSCSYDSLMESFVPFGGFFPTAYDSKGMFSSVYPSGLHYEHCNDKYEQEVSVTLKGHSDSLDDQQNANLPFWLHEPNTVSLNDGFNIAKVCFLFTSLILIHSCGEFRKLLYVTSLTDSQAFVEPPTHMCHAMVLLCVNAAKMRQ